MNDQSNFEFERVTLQLALLCKQQGCHSSLDKPANDMLLLLYVMCNIILETFVYKNIVADIYVFIYSLKWSCLKWLCSEKQSFRLQTGSSRHNLRCCDSRQKFRHVRYTWRNFIPTKTVDQCTWRATVQKVLWHKPKLWRWWIQLRSKEGKPMLQDTGSTQTQQEN